MEEEALAAARELLVVDAGEGSVVGGIAAGEIARRGVVHVGLCLLGEGARGPEQWPPLGPRARGVQPRPNLLHGRGDL